MLQDMKFSRHLRIIFKTFKYIADTYPQVERIWCKHTPFIQIKNIRFLSKLTQAVLKVSSIKNQEESDFLKTLLFLRIFPDLPPYKKHRNHRNSYMVIYENIKSQKVS